jgi:SAM-dependent methyltransferase
LHEVPPRNKGAALLHLRPKLKVPWESLCMKLKQLNLEHLQIQLIRDILHELNVEISTDSTLLDFGCGEGKMVYEFRKENIQAFGVDIECRYTAIQQQCQEDGINMADEDIFRTIDSDNYRIPFEDGTFDTVVSFYVLEHVQNWEQSLAEIKRVLKPGGTSLHIFPSRYSFIEPHVFVPLACIVQGYTYLAFWAFLGIRNSYQKNLHWREVTKLNFEYLRSCTKYYPKAEISKRVASQFDHFTFVEGIYIKHHFGRVRRYLYPLSKTFPIISSLFSTFYTRVLFFKNE